MGRKPKRRVFASEGLRLLEMDERMTRGGSGSGNVGGGEGRGEGGGGSGAPGMLRAYFFCRVYV